MDMGNLFSTAFLEEFFLSGISTTLQHTIFSDKEPLFSSLAGIA
jgi:hypothetical protein